MLAYAGRGPTGVYLNRHLSYAGRAGWTMDTLESIIFGLSAEMSRHEARCGYPVAGIEKEHFLSTTPRV